MCSIIGWHSCRPSKNVIDRLLHAARQRGNDGWGFNIDGVDERGIGEVPPHILELLYLSHNVVGNFRATPTTETESSSDILQPYGGFVHNGTILNDKDFGDYAVDSMCIPDVLNSTTLDGYFKDVQALQGSYAIAKIANDHLYLICNYKPIYAYKTEGGIIFASEEYMLDEWSTQIPPYTYNRFYGDIIEATLELPRFHNRKVAVSLSGGLDSTTAAYMLKDEGFEVIGVYFKYKCVAEDKELELVKKICDHGGFEMVVMDMPNIMGGTITEGTFHDDGREGSKYAFDWVSARNLLMLSMLTAWCENNKVGNMCFGGNLEESGSYPDNEEEFARQFNKLLPYSVQNGVKMVLLHPLSRMMKKDIVEVGTKIGVPYELTWSCYGDGDTHCGSCGPCFMRREAFKRSKLVDPTEYKS